MSGLYDDYRSLISISKQIVKDSLNDKFDLDKISRAVSEGHDINLLANYYWEQNSIRTKASERLRAAKVLEFDTFVYEKDLEKEQKRLDELAAEVKTVLDEWTYNPYSNNWTKTSS